MYIPSYYRQADFGQTFSFMQEFPFATLVAMVDGKPWATHLPFVIRQSGERVVLSSHLSAANPQAKVLADQELLVIFAEPHAYISPRHYNRQENVPTWNYLAVHAYGRARLISDMPGVMALMEDMIGAYEPEYRQQFDALPDKYKLALASEVQAFEIEVEELHSKAKLSQNKKADEQDRIAGYLLKSPHSAERYIGEKMKDRK